MSPPHQTAAAATPEAVERARALALRFGRNATAYQILNPGIRLWFGPHGEAVVGYVQRPGVRVAAGAPVCAPARLLEVAAAFEEQAGGDRVCYFGAEQPLYARLAPRPGYSAVRIGAQPVWDPHRWRQVVDEHASLRAQLNRARNKGVTVSRWPAERARNHPELHRCLREWLATRGLPPMHFLVEPDTLNRLFDRNLFVAEREQRVVGFLVTSPVPLRHGWLIEQFVRGHDAPNGTTELMIDTAVRWMLRQGDCFVTLGLSPLSRRAAGAAPPSPLWLRLLLGWMRAHANRFYNFQGLEAFKAKFHPERWEPIYAVANRPRFSPAILYAVAGAFSGGSPVGMGVWALTRAVRQEWAWLSERLRRTR